MSIQWGDMHVEEALPHLLVNEVYRITALPPGASARDMLELYLQESAAMGECVRSKLLLFCVAVWLKKLYKGDHGAGLDAEVTTKWNVFCQALDDLPDSEQVFP